MTLIEGTKRALRLFRKLTAPLDRLEFAAFLVAAIAGAGILMWAFVEGTIEGAKQGDWPRFLLSVAPIVVFFWGVVSAVLTRRLNWVTISFVALTSAIAFYFLYF